MEADLAARNLSILVADDEPVNRKIIQRLLKHCGLTCDLVEDGFECVSKAMAEDYDLILMDIDMPGMGGIEAARELQKLRGATTPKIIAVTAHVSVAQKEACDQAGFDGFIPKPVKLETLTQVLKESLFDTDTAVQPSPLENAR
ncbi:CheY chemotaxis protein or a CheY-like REC (receiver) domain [Shimia marina]|uniref:Sensory/regulatory protein RpfC n=2 Tax=Shimia marina TaxID=321267 RepID=A0A0N7LRX9_9RHOB|nr:Sensory/regulatory protein RpfC [Shimia marina]SFE83097.1 CheY chemotaxis protein or a CheY-like REC (receiver) domain [Shimia marina]